MASASTQLTADERKLLKGFGNTLYVNPWAIRLARATFGVSASQLADAAKTHNHSDRPIREKTIHQLERYDTQVPRGLHIAEACALALGLEPAAFAADANRLRADRDRYDRWRKDGSPDVLEWAALDAAAPNVALYRPATAGQAADLSAAADGILQAAQWHLQAATILETANNDQQGAQKHRLWAIAALQMATARLDYAFPAIAPAPRPSGVIPPSAKKP